MKEKVSNLESGKFLDEFLKQYLLLGFGNLPKSEIDILVFGLMKKYGFFKKIEDKTKKELDENFFEIALDLKIDEKKVKKYYLDYHQRFSSKDENIKASVKSIYNKIFNTKTIQPEFDKDKMTVSILIDDPIEQRDFIYTLKSIGYSITGNLTKERFTMPIYVLVAVFCRIDDDIFTNFKNKVSEQIDIQSERDKIFNKGLPLLEQVNKGLENINPIINTFSSLVAIFK